MILESIVENKKKELAHYPARKDFLAAITQGNIQVIAEVKQKSPSTGTLCSSYEPEKIAHRYKKGGAAAISVLTDQAFFGGKMSDIARVKEATDLPILCKDFIIDQRQVYEAYQQGADAVLLIMRILSVDEAQYLKNIIESLGMTALIEIFDEHDLDKALKINPKILMINHRNLDTLNVSYDHTQLLIERIPENIPLIAASGISHPEEVLNLPPRIVGVLIGTSLLRAENPEAFIHQLKTPKIKICGITNLEDALLAESLGASFIGFIFEKTSPRFIEYSAAKKIINELKIAKSVGVFVHQSPEEIEKIALDLNLWGVQVYESNVRHPQIRVIQCIRVTEPIHISLPSHDYVLLDTHDPEKMGGTGKTWDWSLMPELLHHCFLSGGISVDNIAQASAYSPFAIDVCSSVESEPGKKDTQKLTALFKVFYEK